MALHIGNSLALDSLLDIKCSLEVSKERTKCTRAADLRAWHADRFSACAPSVKKSVDEMT